MLIALVIIRVSLRAHWRITGLAVGGTVLASQSMTQALGYAWDQSTVLPDVPRFSVERAVWRFRRSLPEYVWDAAVLEGNPFTYPEVRTLLDGITAGGRKISDEQQVLNLAEAANELLGLVKVGEFRLDKEISDRLQYLIARDEALESGHFRGEGKELLTPGVGLGAHGRYMPPQTEAGDENLRRIYARGLEFIQAGSWPPAAPKPTGESFQETTAKRSPISPPRWPAALCLGTCAMSLLSRLPSSAR